MKIKMVENAFFKACRLGKKDDKLNGSTASVLNVFLFTCLFAYGCNNAPAGEVGTDSSSLSITSTISAERSSVNPQPVAVYNYAIPNDLNGWHFTVSLKETKQRFNYLLDMQYQEMTGADTIRFPNFGFEPEPQIKKGSNNLECIIGFLDKEKKFREYIKVFVDDGRLRMKTLKQYAVYQK